MTSTSLRLLRSLPTELGIREDDTDDSDNGWRTLPNGAHIHFDGDGEVDAGPSDLVTDRRPKKGKKSKRGKSVEPKCMLPAQIESLLNENFKDGMKIGDLQIFNLEVLNDGYEDRSSKAKVTLAFQLKDDNGKNVGYCTRTFAYSDKKELIATHEALSLDKSAPLS